ncbi:MAG: hypothetical protein RL513_495 [Pseudomonadota bacterium]|jgi:hypothetical protein
MDHTPEPSTTIGSPETQAVAEQISHHLKEAHRLAGTLPEIEVDGLPHLPIALYAAMDVYDTSRPDERGSQVAIHARGIQLIRILVAQLLRMPSMARKRIILEVIEQSAREKQDAERQDQEN